MAAEGKKICLVTGASRGAGKGVAKAVAEMGMYVVLIARKESDLVNTLKEIEEAGGVGTYIVCGISDREGVKKMAAKVKEEIGLPDVIVNNAGAWCFQDFCESDYESWDWMIDVNIRGHLNLYGEFLPAMKERKSGHFINVTSDSERIPFAGVSVYTGTKFFMDGFCKSLRMELKGSNVRITNVLPGFIWTDGLAGSLRNGKEAEAMKKFGFGDPEELIKKKDLMLQPEDLGKAVVDVLKNNSNYYTYDIMLRDMMQEEEF